MFDSSLPGLTRQSISLPELKAFWKRMDARIKSAHDIGMCSGAGATSGEPSMTLA
jgi:hypothetical protein